MKKVVCTSENEFRSCAGDHLYLTMKKASGSWRSGPTNHYSESWSLKHVTMTSKPRMESTVGQRTSHIKNKIKRSELYAKLLHEKKREKRKQRKKAAAEISKALELGQEPPTKQQPKTIENTREKDETIIQAEDEEIEEDLAEDEFSQYFNREVSPKVLLTTGRKPTAIMYKFLADLLNLFPDATYYKRNNYELKKICQYASKRGFTDLVVINEDRKSINGMLIVHLPDGPTAHFRLSSLRLSKDIKGHGKPTRHRPELVLNNFSTRLGNRIGRMFASLFNQDPEFRGRRVVTFHNQRDFIFFRHHRYIFESKEGKTKPGTRQGTEIRARLQELGPRFTLKLQTLQKGTFDSKHGEFEWVHKPGMDTSRRRFFL